MNKNLTKPQLELIEILKTCLKKSDTNTKYVLVYITKDKVHLIFNKEQFKGEGYYILKINKSQIIIIYPRINGNTVNSLINRGIIKKIDKNQYILDMNSIENNNSREKQLKKLSELKLRLDNKEYKGFKEKLALKKEIKRIEYSLESRDYDKEKELEKKEKEERLNKLKEVDENSKKLAIEWSKKQKLDMPKGANYIYYNKPFSRAKTVAYRGEFKENIGSGSNTGIAMFGQGLYTTTNKSYAKKFGEVRKVSIDELPEIPLRFNNQNDFNQFEYLLSKSLGIKKTDLYLVGEINEIICKLGYDGATIGSGKDMIIVKYFKK